MKIIKLLLIAIVFVGAVVLLVSIIDTDKSVSKQEFDNVNAKEWKTKIDSLCKDGKWSESGYTTLETGIHTDFEAGKGKIISKDEENSLKKYLFTASCDYINGQVNSLFKRSDYPSGQVNAAESRVSFLQGKASDFDKDSKLTEASAIISEYRKLQKALSALSFSSSASYSHPLRAFNVPSVESLKHPITSLRYYNSHFSNNSSVKSQLAGLSSKRSAAESQYYSNLENAVESHYKSSRDLVRLLEDYERFRVISTNSSATGRLNSFIENSNR